MGGYQSDTRVSRKQAAIDFVEDFERFAVCIWHFVKEMLHIYADVGTNLSRLLVGKLLRANATQAMGKVICVFAPLIIIGILFGS